MSKTEKAGFDPKNVKVLKEVSLETMKIETGKKYYLTFNAKIETKTKSQVKEGESPDIEVFPDVTELEANKKVQVVGAAVVLSILNETYPDFGYVGKSFCIEKLPKKTPNQRYFNYNVQEIEI